MEALPICEKYFIKNNICEVLSCPKRLFKSSFVDSKHLGSPKNLGQGILYRRDFTKSTKEKIETEILKSFLFYSLFLFIGELEIIFLFEIFLN
jgi:hypothetical protein